MLCKGICQKCYRYHEREWDSEVEREWDSEGCIVCPVDHFKTIRYKGKPTETGKMSGLFRWIFGWHEIADGIPEYCEFGDEHEEGTGG